MYTYNADKGKVWKHKKTGEVVGATLSVMRQGTVKLYEQVKDNTGSETDKLGGFNFEEEMKNA